MTFVQSTNVNKTEAKTLFGLQNNFWDNVKKNYSVFGKEFNNNPEGNVDSYNASNPVNPVKSKTISAEELNNNLDEIIESLIAEAKANGEENLYEYVYNKLNEYVNNNIKDETQRIALLNKYLQSQRIADLSRIGEQGEPTYNITYIRQNGDVAKSPSATDTQNLAYQQYLNNLPEDERKVFLDKLVYSMQLGQSQGDEWVNNYMATGVLSCPNYEQNSTKLSNEELQVFQDIGSKGTNEFTPEQKELVERAFLKWYQNKGFAIGMMTRTAKEYNNGNLDEEQASRVVSQSKSFVEDNLGESLAIAINDEVVIEVAEALQNEELSDDAIAFLNEVTNGNFSIALYNIQHGTDIPFNSMQSEDEGTAQSEAGASASVSSEAGTAQNNKPIENNLIENKTVDLGFNQKTETQPELPKIEIPLEGIQAAPSASATCIKKAPTTIAEVLSPEGNIIQKIIEFTNRVGIVSAAQKLIESGDSYCRDFALNNILERFNNGQQVNLYNRLTDCSSRIETIRRITDLDVLKKLRAVDLITTKFKEERTEVLAERNPGSINSIA